MHTAQHDPPTITQGMAQVASPAAMQKALRLEAQVWGLCLILAPLVSALSTFFWQGSEYGIVAGTLGFLSCVLWIPGLIGLFGLLRAQMPRYATLGLVIAIYGAVGGAAFGFEGLYTAALGISQDQAIDAWLAQPTPFNLTLFWPGPLFPLSLLVLGINLARTKTVPSWAGVLLALGAIAFPLSRIPRIEWIAHSVDLLLLIPAAYLGWLLLRGKSQTTR